MNDRPTRDQSSSRARTSEPAPAKWRTSLRNDAVTAFERRVAKNLRHWSRWARRQDLGAFRTYDRDIPEFPLAIDCYVPADRAQSPRLHVQEVETGWLQSVQEHIAWMAAVHEALTRTTGIAREFIVYKRRPRRHGHEQHTRTGVTGKPFLVTENGLKFWVDLEQYLDTGLFLDHRRMRAMVRASAQRKRVLNLFGYTGSFTVYAAAGGAFSTDTVDLSNTYLAWAARNLAANAIDMAAHRLVRADVLLWLQQAAQEGRRFELIVCDPPAFSNSKSMVGVLDVQRDHVVLIRRCLDLLAAGGELYFSTNLRTFTLDAQVARHTDYTDITAQTRAEDFRDARVHQAFLFRSRT